MARKMEAAFGIRRRRFYMISYSTYIYSLHNIMYMYIQYIRTSRLINYDYVCDCMYVLYVWLVFSVQIPDACHLGNRRATNMVKNVLIM